MSVLKKFHTRIGKHNLINPDSGDEIDSKRTLNSSKRDFYEPARSDSANLGAKYKNDYGDLGGMENESVQELENFAVYKSEETTKSVHGCLKIAENMRSDATRTLGMLHEQGEQITRTHQTAADIDRDLSRGEKLLGSLGGMFSKTWKPKKTRQITGPVTSRDDSPKKRANHLEQRKKLGLKSAPNKEDSKARKLPQEPKDAYERIEVEQAKQDDGLSALSAILGDLKLMAEDMGSEIRRQNEGLDRVEDDVDVLNDRVDQANRRARRLLRK